STRSLPQVIAGPVLDSPPSDELDVCGSPPLDSSSSEVELPGSPLDSSRPEVEVPGSPVLSPALPPPAEVGVAVAPAEVVMLPVVPESPVPMAPDSLYSPAEKKPLAESSLQAATESAPSAHE